MSTVEAANSLVSPLARYAANCPNDIAVVTDDVNVTYEELWSNARDLAVTLRNDGITPGDVVAVMADRGPDLVTTIVGVAMSGAAYLPLAPDHPTMRLRRIVEDAGAAATVASSAYMNSLHDSRPSRQEMSIAFHAGGRTMTFDREIACVLYTSGSTGSPKGVAITSAAVRNLTEGCDFVPTGPGVVIGNLSNPGFDALTFEIWAALLNGGVIRVLTTPILSAVPHQLAETADGRPSVLFVTTALFNQLVRHASRGLAAVGNVLFGGEMADAIAVQQFLSLGTRGELFHVYGPTETTTFATSWHVDNETFEARSPSVPIGSPLRGVHVHLIDEEGHEVEDGEFAELFIGGTAVGAGYVGHAAIGDTRFRDDPFCGGQMYQTGDKVRQVGGLLEIAGRLDDQVKIRGYRIEPHEVAVVLRGHPAVSDAAVLVDKTGPEAKVVAYFVGSPDVANLRGHLAQQLPAYMSPRLIRVESIPLTPNGKVDRARLAQMAAEDVVGSD